MERKTNTYFTKKKRICDCGKQQNVNCIVPGGASDGLFPDGGGGGSTGSGSFEGKEGGERKREMEADRGIKSDSAALSPGSLCWLSSSKQIETNRICRSCLQ